MAKHDPVLKMQQLDGKKVKAG